MTMFVSSPNLVNKTARPINSNAEDLSVTPSDTTDFAFSPSGPARGLRVTGAGNVAVNLASGGTAVLTGLSAGQVVWIETTRILATGTTATGISVLV